jgi:hypothetical protein
MAKAASDSSGSMFLHGQSEHSAPEDSLRLTFASEVARFEERAALPSERQMVWDYFFHESYDNVGRPEDAEAAELWQSLQDRLRQMRESLQRSIEAKRQELESKIASSRSALESKIASGRSALEARLAKLGKRASVTGVLAALAVVALLVAALAQDIDSDVRGGIATGTAVFLLITLPISIVAAVQSRAARKRQDDEERRMREQCESDIAALREHSESEIAALRERGERDQAEESRRGDVEVRDMRARAAQLRAMIPPVPSDEAIDGVMRKDLSSALRCAKERIALTAGGVAVDDQQIAVDLPPICEPGVLQTDVPYRLKTTWEHHLQAMHRTHTGDDRYAVNYYQYLLPSEHQLNVYGTFFDHVLGELHGELTDTFYFSDVVALSTRTQSLTLNIHSETIVVPSAFTVVVGLSNGDHISFNIRDDESRKALLNATADQEVKRLEGQQEYWHGVLSTAHTAGDAAAAGIAERELTRTSKELTEVANTPVPQTGIDSAAETIVRFLRKHIREHKLS